MNVQVRWMPRAKPRFTRRCGISRAAEPHSLSRIGSTRLRLPIASLCWNVAASMPLEFMRSCCERRRSIKACTKRIFSERRRRALLAVAKRKLMLGEPSRVSGRVLGPNLAAYAARLALPIVVLLLLSAFLFFHRLAYRDLWSSHEARAAQNAQRMLDEDEWLLPRLFDGHLDMQKPPLYYWLVAAIGRLQGGTVDAWAVRLPAAASATILTLAVWWTLFWRGRALAGTIAAIVLATSQHFTWLARTGRIDMVLTLTVAAAILNLAYWQRGHVLGYLMMAAGLLLKGPIGLVLPLAVVVLKSAMEQWLKREPAGQARTVTPSLARAAGSFVWGIPLAIFLAAAWFLLANQNTHGEFFRVFIWHHNVERALGTSEELAVHP